MLTVRQSLSSGVRLQSESVKGKMFHFICFVLGKLDILINVAPVERQKCCFQIIRQHTFLQNIVDPVRYFC